MQYARPSMPVARALVWHVLVLLLLAALPVTAAQTLYLIQPGVGLGDIKLGDGKARIIEIMGQPDREGWTETEPKSYNYQYDGPQIYVLVRKEKVHSIFTLNPYYKTQQGVGVGSTLSEVESALGGSHERKEGSVGPELIYASGVRFVFVGDKVVGVEVRAVNR